jgi:hypothetical protein
MALFSTAVNCKYPEKEIRQKGLMNGKQDELRIWTGYLYLKPKGKTKRCTCDLEREKGEPASVLES